MNLFLLVYPKSMLISKPTTETRMLRDSKFHLDWQCLHLPKLGPLDSDALMFLGVLFWISINADHSRVWLTHFLFQCFKIVHCLMSSLKWCRFFGTCDYKVPSGIAIRILWYQEHSNNKQQVLPHRPVSSQWIQGCWYRCSRLQWSRVVMCIIIRPPQQ